MHLQVQTPILLNNDTIINIVGFIIVALLTVGIAMIRYIWTERKRMLENEIRKREEYNVSIKKELDEVKHLSNDQKLESVKLYGTLRQLNTSVENLTGWLKKVDKELSESIKQTNANTANIQTLRAFREKEKGE